MVLLGILNYASSDLGYTDLLCTLFSGLWADMYVKRSRVHFNYYCCYYFQLAMKPADLSEVLGSVFEQALQLKKATEASTGFIRAPNVTVSYLLNGLMQPGHYYNWKKFMSQVFLDELNASTCGGLFKEMIIDRTFEGEVTANIALMLRYWCWNTLHFMHFQIIMSVVVKGYYKIGGSNYLYGNNYKCMWLYS